MNDSRAPSDQTDPGPHLASTPVDFPIASSSGEPLLSAVKPGLGPDPQSNDFDEAEKQQFLWQVHEYLSEYSRFGDTKAAFAGTLSTALLGALYSAKAYLPILRTTWAQWSISSWLIIWGAAFLLLSVGLGIWTILPRLRTTQSKGFIYWGSIAAHGSIQTLQTSFHSQSARTLNDHLLHHVFDISSKVCVPKYRTVSLSIWALFVGGLLAASGLVMLDAPQAKNTGKTKVQTQGPATPIQQSK